MSRITLILPAVLLASLTFCLGADSSVEEAYKILEADLAALHQASEPATGADLEAPPVADAANGAIDLRAAHKAIDETSDTYQRFAEEDISSPPTPEQLQMFRALAAENAKALNLVESAVAKGQFDWRIKVTSPMIKVLLPDLAQQRVVAIIVQASAIAAHADADDELALRRIHDLLGLSRAVDVLPYLVSHLVASGAAVMATDACALIVPSLDAGAGTPARNRAEALITELLDETSARNGFLLALQAERLMQPDTALAIADGTLQPDELVSWTPAGANRPTVPPDRQVAQRIALEDAHRTMQHSTQWLIAASAPDWPTAKSKFPAKPTFTPDRYFARQMLPSLERAIQRQYVYLASRRLAAIALAARCYALDHAGNTPKSLNDLTPKYLPVVPSDPFTMDQPMRYLPDKAIIYSIGSDGKDDGGREAKPKARQPDIVVRLRP